jgi:hypothetical protein
MIMTRTNTTTEKKAGATGHDDVRPDMSKLIPVFVIVLVDLLGLTIIVPLLPLYSASFGASPFVVGLLVAAYPVMQIIGRRCSVACPTAMDASRFCSSARSAHSLVLC